MNQIYLRRKQKWMLKAGNNELPPKFLATLLKNIEPLGYTLSPELAERVLSLSLEQLARFYKELESSLREMLGAHKEHKPMYPNFPEQVMQSSEAELYWIALWHYFGDWIGRRIMPAFEKQPRAALSDDEKTPLRVIQLGNAEEFKRIFTHLIAAKSSLSIQDKADLQWFVRNRGSSVLGALPPEIPLRENRAYLGALLLQLPERQEALAFVQQHMSTATDVLRLAVALAEGDVSLAEPCRFPSFPKWQRRLMLQLLEACSQRDEDFQRFTEPWKRLAERLHPYDYVKRYPQTAQSFTLLWNKLPVKTFRSEIEAALQQQNLNWALRLLSQRPGELARRLDHLLRCFFRPEEQEQILACFSKRASEVSSPVLLQLQAHIQTRHIQTLPELRSFFPKGDVAKIQAIANNLPSFSQALCEQIAQICDLALLERFAEFPDLGRFYLDPALKYYTVPFGLRSAAKTLKTLPRGSRLPLPVGSHYLRFFIWWQDGKRRTDLDLSALALSDQHAYVTTLSYYNLKDLGAYHSGDITSAPQGASEFIDIDKRQFLAAGIRYVLMVVNSFTQQPFCDLPECFAGFMLRKRPQSGEIYEPRTVANRYDLSANTRISIPLIIDLHSDQVIWTDLALRRHPAHNNNVHNNLSSLTLLSRAMTERQPPNLYSLLALHMQARGQQVAEPSLADTVLTAEARPAEGTSQRWITPLDQEILLAEFL